MPFDQGGLSPVANAPVVAFGPSDVVRLEGVDVLHITSFRPDHDRIVAAGGRVALDTAPGQAGLAVVCLPRNRTEGLGRIAQALEALAPGGILFVDGQKTDGIDAALKKLRRVLAVSGTASKAHGKIAWAHRPDPLPPRLAEWRANTAPSLNTDGFQTAPGMFSADGIDPASALLIAHLPSDASGLAADLGAGWGALSAALLASAPGLTGLDLIEADHAALQAAQANVTDTRARFHWADATRWGGGPYDLIIANPPFHVARTAEPSLGQAFIRTAANLLRPKGRLLMVANRQLPYEASFEAAFLTWSPLTTTTHYKILTATRPRNTRRAA